MDGLWFMPSAIQVAIGLALYVACMAVLARVLGFHRLDDDEERP